MSILKRLFELRAQVENDTLIIEDINTENVKVYGVNGEIIIEGEYENVAVYSVTGQKYSTLKVPAGVYVVNIDGNSTKVLVK